MPAPLIVLGAGIAGSVILGYILEKTVGDGHYSSRDLAVDATMGIIPGVGYAKPAVSIARKGNILRRMGMARGMYSKRELYLLPFVDEALQIFYRTPIVAGSLNAIAKIGDDRVKKSNPDSIRVSGVAKIRGATTVKPKKGKCPSGYFYDRKKRMCVKRTKKSKAHTYNKKRN
ncbi:MAG: hypothetical protein [Circular genetic element sp.]|nr:MAG: hypothetical protein [Circular genetic element sp.]